MTLRIPSSVLSLMLLLPTAALARVGHHSHGIINPHAHAAHRPSVHHHTPAHEDHGPHVKVMKGWSSWYGPEMRVGNHYRRMANGQRFDPHKFTAASRTLPLGTVVQVKNLKTGQAVQVKITDRGPYVRSRILDLAEGPAKAIGCKGACPIELAELKTPEGTTS